MRAERVDDKFDCVRGERVSARDDDFGCVRGEMAGTAPWLFVVAVCLMKLYSHVEGVDRTRLPLAYLEGGVCICVCVCVCACVCVCMCV